MTERGSNRFDTLLGGIIEVHVPLSDRAAGRLSVEISKAGAAPIGPARLQQISEDAHATDLEIASLRALSCSRQARAHALKTVIVPLAVFVLALLAIGALAVFGMSATDPSLLRL